jgi:hypothetical protein
MIATMMGACLLAALPISTKPPGEMLDVVLIRAVRTQILYSQSARQYATVTF